MAFTPASLSLIVQPLSGTGRRIFSYITEDSVDDVTTTGYFFGIKTFGAKVGDMIYCLSASGLNVFSVKLIDLTTGTAEDDSRSSLDIASLIEAIAGENNTKVMTPLRVHQAAVYAEYTPSAPNTYPHNLHEDLEWDRVSTLSFLDETQRADTIGNDCWESLQNMADFLRDHSESDDTNAIKHMWLGGRTYRIDQTLAITGLRDGDGPRRGRVILEEGSLFANTSWEDQTTFPSPMVEFKNNSQGSGMRFVYLNCNGVCSGALANSTDGNSKILFEHNVIANFANPQLPFQSDIYTNLVDIGAGNMVSSFPMRKYEDTDKYAIPYGIRVGTKIPVVYTATTVNSTTCRLSGNHIRQWENGRTEALSYRRRTGIGIWLATSDNYITGATNNSADCLKGLVVEGHSNFIKDLHISPTGPSTEYDVNDGPTSVAAGGLNDVYVIGTEQLSGLNIYSGVYHERMMVLSGTTGTKAVIVGCRFPRRNTSTDANTGAVIFDAAQVDDKLSDEGRPAMGVNHCDIALNRVEFREADGNTWLDQPDVSQMNDLDVYFSSSGTAITSGNRAQSTPLRVLSSDADASRIVMRHAAARDWVTGTAYTFGEYVLESATQYQCLEDHTAGVFATDLAAVKWIARDTVDVSIGNYRGQVEFEVDGAHVTRIDSDGLIRAEGGFSAESNSGTRLAIGAQNISGYPTLPTIGSQFSQQIHGDTVAKTGLVLVNWGAGPTQNAVHAGAKSGSSTIGTHGIVSASDSLAQTRGYGDDGVDFIEAGRISIEVDAIAPAATKMPGVITFSTATAATPSVLTEALKIDSDQDVMVTGRDLIVENGDVLIDTGLLSVAGSIYTTGSILVDGTQVVTNRQTGWSADTGTDKRTANATYSGTAEVGYTQATIQTLMDEVRDLSQTIKALKADLTTHGLIGP